ncbi:hypothetical protein GCM10027589_12230 [Actinocorallia lasiicapitis]
MRSVIAYTTARVLLFAATACILYLIGLTGLINLALSVLISGIVSYVLLSRQRDAVSATLVQKKDQLAKSRHGEE